MKPADQMQEHTRSYYAASANDLTQFPALKGSHSADVCVVGAGFTGVSTALSLSERGYSVAVIEANRVGWGASGRNGGQLIHGIGGLDRIRKRHGDTIADTVWALKWLGHDIIHERVEKYDIECDLKGGFAEVALKSRQLPELEALAREFERHQFPYEYALWDQQETQDALGTDAYLGGFVCQRDGHLHPLNLCMGEARAAQKLGAAIFEQSPALRIEHGSRPKVKTSDGVVEADAVILAGNAYSLLEPKHVSGYVFPAGSYIIATEPLPEPVAAEINALDVAVCDVNEIVNYYRLSADKRMLFGGACNYSGRDPTSIQSYILPRMLKIYPQLKGVPIEYEWGGKIGIVLERAPMVGRIHSNVYFAQGYSGHGVNASHVMGELVAEAISGTMERFDLFAEIQHLRIPGSRWFGNQMIALGMLYYKLRDML